jgi:hypothetical protein
MAESSQGLADPLQRIPPAPAVPINQYLEESIRKSRYRTAHTYALEVGATWAVRRAHSLHTLVPRLGGFPPGLARWAIEAYSRPEDTVLDLYCGKGTAPLEALLAKRQALGNDLAPDAYVITHAKLSGVSHDRAVALLARLNLDAPLVVTEVPEHVRLFFHDETLSQILSLRAALFDILRIAPGHIDALSTRSLTGHQHEAMYLLACLLGCLHGPVDWKRNRDGDQQKTTGESLYLSVHCNHTYSASPKYVQRYCDTHGLKPPRRDVAASIRRKSSLAQADGLPIIRGQAFCGSAETFDTSGQVSLIVTSPPYFRAQTYAWDNWLRLWCLGYDDYRDVGKRLLHTDSIPRYYCGLRTSMARAKSLLASEGGYLIMVVGDVGMHSKGTKQRQPFLHEDGRIERYVSIDEDKGAMINTSEIVADIATELGFKVEMILNDFIPRSDRALAAFLTKTNGADIDRILVLQNADGQ